MRVVWTRRGWVCYPNGLAAALTVRRERGNSNVADRKRPECCGESLVNVTIFGRVDGLPVFVYAGALVVALVGMVLYVSPEIRRAIAEQIRWEQAEQRPTRLATSKPWYAPEPERWYAPEPQRWYAPGK